jgi:hypothetical protein
MNNPSEPNIDDAGGGLSGAGANDVAALLAAFREMLMPIARLAVARGVQYSEIDDILRLCFVASARDVHANAATRESRLVSRISATTGLHRREAKRLLEVRPVESSRRRSPANEIFIRWQTDPAYRDEHGQPMDLPRSGSGPSFESLSGSITLDLSARSLLEELCRLGLVGIDPDSGLVRLIRDAFVPQDDERRLLGLVAANIGDHLQAAVANVLAPDDPPFLERAIFADELSRESLEQVRPLFEEQWRSLARAIAPVLQTLIGADHAAGRPQDQRVRIGLYTFNAAMASDQSSPAPLTQLPANQPRKNSPK